MSEPSVKNKVVLLSGNSNLELSEKIASLLNIPLYKPVRRFADSEAMVQIPTNIRREHVIILQSTCPPNVDSNIIELFLMIDAAKRASAKEITVIIPYFGYARQDRKDKPRVPVSSAAIAKTIEFLGADRICTVDIHADQEQGFVSIPWDNLYGSFTLLPEIEDLDPKDLIVASPDKGGVLKATAYSSRLNAQGIAIVFKERDVNTENKSQALDMIGDVKGKNVLLVDDMIDTGGTLCNAADLLYARGAKSVIASATHGLFTRDALEKINKSAIEKVIVTDTVPLKEEVLKNPKIKVVTIAPLLSRAIEIMVNGGSISQELINWTD